ncbi:MAG: hypothetical protein V3U80_07000 [Flavobacteriaceae bacterium]
MRDLIRFLFILILSVNTYAQDSEIQEELLSLEKNNFHINYPKNWNLNENQGVELLLFSKLTDEKDQFKENINLIIQDLSGHNITNLDDFVALSEKQILTMLKDVVITSSERVVEKDTNFQKVKYSGKMKNFNLTFIQYYWYIDSKAYVLTFTSETSQYNRFEKVAKQIMDSFKIIE